MSLFGRKTASAPAPKPPKPQPKPQLSYQPKSVFDGKNFVSRKDAIHEARMREINHQQVVVPGTGGQKMPSKDYTKLLEKSLPSYQKTGFYTNEVERKNILRQMRKKDGGIPSRERRILEDQWGLKGKY